jgi:hypothetical protein
MMGQVIGLRLSFHNSEVEGNAREEGLGFVNRN